MADNFPVRDFTPGTKEGPELWRWVEVGPAPCVCFGAKAYCGIVLVCRADVPRGSLNSLPGQCPGTREAQRGFFIMLS